MPLMIMSPNVERDSPSRKRTHEEYSEDTTSDAPSKNESQDARLSLPGAVSGASHSTSQAFTTVASSPPGSPASLIEPSSSMKSPGSMQPNTPTRQPLTPLVQSTNNTPTPAQNTADPVAGSTAPSTEQSTMAGPPAPKRKKLTAAEKVMKEQEEAAKRAEREKLRQEKEADRIAKQEEKEKKKAETEAARQAKLQAKEEKRLEQEKKDREKKEEAERKARAQPKIANFFAKKDSAAPKQSNVIAVVKARSPSPAARVAVQTEYRKLAIPFFVHDTVTMAKSPFAVDKGTQETKAAIIDDYLTGKRSPFPTKPFDPVDRLNLVAKPPPRGRSYPSVKELLSDEEGAISNPIDLPAERLSLPSHHSLKDIPMKQFSFHEDVRPGYYGTVTNVPTYPKIKKMAKNPVAKDLPLDYDYDSEAEWVQGDEEEDVEGMDEMSEEDDDEDETMHDFLDDADDNARLPGPLAPAGSSMEPEVSGICFEDRLRQNPDPQMYRFRMEFIIPNLVHHHSIDPFSPAYWPSDTKGTSSPSSKATPSTMAPPPAPKPASGPATALADLIPAQDMDEFKATILEFKFLPKAAMLPTLKKKFDRIPSGQIKATLEHVAEKPPKKDWKLKEAV